MMTEGKNGEGGQDQEWPGEPLTVSRPQLLVRGNDEAFRQFVHDTLAFASRIQAA